MSAVYNFPDVAVGQTLEQRVFGLERYQNGTLVTLTGCTVVAEIKSINGNRTYLTKSSASGGVIINDENTCVVTLTETQITLSPKRYVWDITVTYPDGDVKKFAVGYFKVVSLKDFADV